MQDKGMDVVAIAQSNEAIDRRALRLTHSAKLVG